MICHICRKAGLFSFELTPAWLLITLSTCAILFPLCDPLIGSAWGSMLNLFFGDPSSMVPQAGELSLHRSEDFSVSASALATEPGHEWGYDKQVQHVIANMVVMAAAW